MADQNDSKAPAAPVAAPWANPAATAAPSPEAAAPAADATVVATVESAVTKVEEASAAVATEVLDMVTVTVPRAFKLALDHFHVKDFKAGVQQMERSHAEHWFAKNNGVEIYDPQAKAAE